MFNFCKIVVSEKKRDLFFIEPKFKVAVRDSDLMIRGGDFYAAWDEDSGLWVTDRDFVVEKIDRAVMETYENLEKREGAKYIPLLMNDSDSGMIDKWNKYCKKQLVDRFHVLDTKIIFNNTEISRNDYVSKKLPYDLVEGDCPCYDELIGTLYTPEERRKIEWALGSVIAGESKELQKFIVLYGAPGSGKSTILDIVEKLFVGYCNAFESKAVGSAKDFALDTFKDNPLISIDHEGDLSKIESNIMLNSLTAHNKLVVNPKYEKKYQMRINALLMIATNKPVKITDAKSGIIRRLIDIYPSGNLIKPKKKYDALVKGINFELGAIAYRVLKVFEELGPTYYDAYVPLKMISETNDFYDFMEYYYDDFCKKEYVVLQDVWELYKNYVEMANVRYPLPRRQMSIELGNYFTEYKESYYSAHDKHYRSVYFGFRKDKFVKVLDTLDPDDKKNVPEWLRFETRNSIFDIAYGDARAQYATEGKTPAAPWSVITTKLKDISTERLHYVLPQDVNEKHIVVDFDKKDAAGNKSLSLNIEAASQWPPTYAEISQGGNGIHLHYIYEGDVSKLSNVYDDNIEIKTFGGKSSLRRRVSYCNDLNIARLTSGLPQKKEKKEMVDKDIFKSEKDLIGRIKACLDMKPHPQSRFCNVQYIKKSLDDAYNSGMSYDVSTMYQDVSTFAASSKRHEQALKLVQQMHFKSKDREEFVWDDTPFADDAPIVFYDVEVFPNLFLINWKFEDSKKCKRMINPSPLEVTELFKYKLIGFNNLRYDNIMLIARARGASEETLYEISKRLIHGTKGAVSKEISYTANRVSYLDLYDVATKKQSLKKWEIELHIHHKELGFNWDEPVPEEKWAEVAEYCDNDVFATQAVYYELAGDIEARLMLSEMSGCTPNTPDNQQSAKIIFGDDKGYKSEFVYTDLSTIFPGYKFEGGKSTYLGEEVGEGGAVRAKHGMYGKTKVFDIVSMHPHSVKELNLFGPKYTARFYALVELRVAIKHGDIDKIKTMFDGRLVKYIEDKAKLKAIASALKIVINSVYGLSCAHFDNPFKDPRNVDNIVAKRGALFMLTLKHELEMKGIDVIHIKTDSIKLEDPSPEIEQFVYDFGKKYGYTFEIEHEYEKICLINDSTYIAKYLKPEMDGDREVWWDATGTEFQRPYVYKTLFSHEAIEFYDLCETKQVNKGAMYLDYNPDGEDNPDKRVFVGRVGLFCPIKENGGRLVRDAVDKEGNVKYDSVQGTSGYRWVEAEDIGPKGMKLIDRSYYTDMVDKAKAKIEKFGDFEMFAS